MGGPSKVGATRERIENRDTRVRDRRRVVVAVDLPDERLASIEIEPLDLIQLALDEINRLRMERRRAARKVGLADDARLLRRVDDNEVVRGYGAQTHGVGRIRFIRPRPVTLAFW